MERLVLGLSITIALLSIAVGLFFCSSGGGFSIFGMLIMGAGNLLCFILNLGVWLSSRNIKLGWIIFFQSLPSLFFLWVLLA